MMAASTVYFVNDSPEILDLGFLGEASTIIILLTSKLLYTRSPQFFRTTCMSVRMQREQIGACRDDIRVRRLLPTSREQIGGCADDTHFWRSRPTHRIAPFSVYFAYNSTKISNLRSFRKALRIEIQLA